MRLNKIQLVQLNLIMLVFLVLFAYLAKSGVSFSVLWGLCCALLWLTAAMMFYTLKTGKTIGTKAIRRVEEFYKDHWGEKRWKRKRMTGAVSLSILSIIFTAFLFVIDFNSARLDSFSPFSSLVGSWIGINAVEIFRISNLKGKVPVS